MAAGPPDARRGLRLPRAPVGGGASRHPSLAPRAARGGHAGEAVRHAGERMAKPAVLARSPEPRRTRCGVAAPQRYWRVRRMPLLEAIRDHPKRSHWRTQVPLASDPPWTGYLVARAMVATASGYDPDGAAAWLVARAVSADPKGPPPAVRARFGPRALAELERGSDRESGRARYPSMILSDLADGGQDIGSRPGCCAWYPPRAALPSGECPDSGSAIEQVEWHGDDLRAALGREFAPGLGGAAFLPAAKKAKSRAGIDGAPRSATGTRSARLRSVAARGKGPATGWTSASTWMRWPSWRGCWLRSAGPQHGATLPRPCGGISGVLRSLG